MNEARRVAVNIARLPELLGAKNEAAAEAQKHRRRPCVGSGTDWQKAGRHRPKA
jgi:hypothetical protein